MADTKRTTSTGTTVQIDPSPVGPLVILRNPNAPEAMREYMAGRLIDGGFQPAPFSECSLSPEALRLLADVIEEADRG